MVLGGESVVDSSTLVQDLRYFTSLLAVGTQHATLFLIDLAMDIAGILLSIIKVLKIY